MGTSTNLLAPLFTGPIDIIGDVHGEYEALVSLLNVLGYDQDGTHPQDRRLVLVGDLVDRGPDSPSVIDLAKRLVDNGTAQCILGNHELNLMMGKKKDGNGWFSEEHEAVSQQKGWIYPWKRTANPKEQQRYLDFFNTLPLALERRGALPLRVVHACWSPESFAAVSDTTDVGADCLQRDGELKDNISPSERLDITQFYERYNLHKEHPPVPMCTALAEYETRLQMNNPIKVITSGMEGPMRTGDPAYLSGKYRMVERLPWWEQYSEEVPVIFGHYWRSLNPSPNREYQRLFGNSQPSDWLGPRHNAYCVDFSVGRRYRERRMGATSFRGQLGALRVPADSESNWSVAFSNGTSIALDRPNA